MKNGGLREVGGGEERRKEQRSDVLVISCVWRAGGIVLVVSVCDTMRKLGVARRSASTRRRQKCGPGEMLCYGSKRRHTLRALHELERRMQLL